MQSGTARVRPRKPPKQFRTSIPRPAGTAMRVHRVGSMQVTMTRRPAFVSRAYSHADPLPFHRSRIRPIIHRSECGAFQVPQCKLSAFLCLKLEYNSIRAGPKPSRRLWHRHLILLAITTTPHSIITLYHGSSSRKSGLRYRC